MAYRVKIELDGYFCFRCQHSWVPRKVNAPEPTVCPGCHSPYWRTKARQIGRMGGSRTSV